MPDKMANSLGDIIAKRDKHFINDWSKGAYLLHPQLRGRRLPPAAVRDVVVFLTETACLGLH